MRKQDTDMISTPIFPQELEFTNTGYRLLSFCIEKKIYCLTQMMHKHFYSHYEIHFKCVIAEVVELSKLEFTDQ